MKRWRDEKLKDEEYIELHNICLVKSIKELFCGTRARELTTDYIVWTSCYVFYND